MGVETSDINLAMQVFARGWAFSRSRTHPSQAERVAGMWVIRDAPRDNGRGYRREEWVAHGMSAAEVDAGARLGTRGHFAVCAIRTAAEPEGPMRAEYKAIGYRLGTTEPFMMHRMGRIPKLPAPLPIERVSSAELAALLGKATDGGRWRQNSTRPIRLGRHSSPSTPARRWVGSRASR
ncbi:MAG TPA: hypothetical protein VHY37_07430 [Tepidisphaeraceae bacterium]|nr:hypothetical protein [Tepidisphaeraceae bacterium]